MSTRTIFARASGQGKSAIAVYRLSGPGAFGIIHRITKMPLPSPRKATLRRIVIPETGHTLDEGLVILFPGPKSFSGEDLAELHLHGSIAVENELADLLLSQGAKPAEPGEFTLRAMQNNKLDLAQIEGLADVLDAETKQQRMQAIGQYGGRLSKQAASWRESLLAALASFDVSIDFADEAEAPETALKAKEPIEDLLINLKKSASEFSKAAMIRRGMNVALIGRPNAGKSSLLNYLLGDDRAIVSPEAGTTRDVIEAALDVDGRRITLFDTAGLRDEASGSVEEEGMRRTRRTAQSADLRLILIDPLTDVPRETFDLLEEGDIAVLTKQDLVDPSVHRRNDDFGLNPTIEHIGISSVSGDGIERLTSLIASRYDQLSPERSDVPLTRVRHVNAVNEAIVHLEASLQRIATEPELAAEDIRLANRSLGRIVGVVDVEDVLGEIFSSFCIGK
ncbi:MAG: tRNA uridine-5-carboxymethylaminomethyl(34) synthesis GTPase MnmE [Pseudomonadota bacterium]